MHAIALDSKYGVPTVAIHTNVFEKAVQSVTRMHGMPEARYTFVPQPVMGKTAEQLRAYVDGKSSSSTQRRDWWTPIQTTICIVCSWKIIGRTNCQ